MRRVGMPAPSEKAKPKQKQGSEKPEQEGV